MSDRTLQLLLVACAVMLAFLVGVVLFVRA